jgi:alkylation response protein AidB-like acyl-CoA dehydrogenase
MSERREEYQIEDVESFRQRARSWITAHVGHGEPRGDIGMFRVIPQEDELRQIARDRELQRLFYDAGFAGICVPTAYGGQGLTPAHQRVFNEELVGYEHAGRIQLPTMTPCLAVLLDFGTEEQKQRFVPPILKGEAIWMQLLSEPSGGSDVAGALTTAVRDGDEWILNGSKVWTTGAWWSDWGLCLARTNWEVAKHRGLTVFAFPLHAEGVEVQQIEMLNGSKEFCQEFLTDLRVPDADRIGEVDDGWTVGTRWMFHERMLQNSPLVTIPMGVVRGRAGFDGVLDVARDTGRVNDPLVRDLIGEARMLEVVRDQLQDRVSEGIASGAMSDQSAGIARLFHGVSGTRMNTIAFEVAGGVGAAWTDADGSAGRAGLDFLMRQTAQIGGGTTEMARNVISERVLGMPRERTLDRGVAFRDVPRGPTGRTN